MSKSMAKTKRIYYKSQHILLTTFCFANKSRTNPKMFPANWKEDLVNWSFPSSTLRLTKKSNTSLTQSVTSIVFSGSKKFKYRKKIADSRIIVEAATTTTAAAVDVVGQRCNSKEREREQLYIKLISWLSNNSHNRQDNNFGCKDD